MFKIFNYKTMASASEPRHYDREMAKMANMVIEHANLARESVKKDGHNEPNGNKYPTFHISELVKKDGDSNRPMTEEEKNAALHLHAILHEFFPLKFEVNNQGMVQIRNGTPEYPYELHQDMFNLKWKTMMSSKSWDESEENAILTLTLLHFEELKIYQNDEWDEKIEEDLEEKEAKKEFMKKLRKPVLSKDELLKRYIDKEAAVLE